MNHACLIGLRAVRYFNLAQADYSRSLERIASGKRIIRAADDPAGLAISERMRAQIRGLKQASRNAQDGISLLQVADGALNETHAILQRLRELAVYAGNGTLSQADRAALQTEFTELVKAIDDIGNYTNFNTIPLLTGERNEQNPIILQIGANSGQNTDIAINDMRGAALGLYDEEGSILSIMTPEDADAALEKIDHAITKVSTQRSYIGAKVKRLEHTINNLETTAINLADAESRIRDVDIAAEIIQMVQAQIRMQAALAMVAQANMSQQLILQLLLPK